MYISLVFCSCLVKNTFAFSFSTAAASAVVDVAFEFDAFAEDEGMLLINRKLCHHVVAVSFSMLGVANYGAPSLPPHPFPAAYVRGLSCMGYRKWSHSFVLQLYDRDSTVPSRDIDQLDP